MNYIVFDLEFNQDFSSESGKKLHRSFFEIVQIGAVKLDENLNTLDTFDRFIKPSVYPVVNPYITELTGITTERLESEKTFPESYEDFTEFACCGDVVFCVWGMADLKELYRNISYHKLDQKLLSKKYINLQSSAAHHFGLPQKNLPKLKSAVELLSIPLVYSFHNAFHDALYTAEVFRRINREFIKILLYDPDHTPIRPRQVKQTVDYSKLIRQFEKMYDRELTEEEQTMIKLAYKMGKTRQFLK